MINNLKALLGGNGVLTCFNFAVDKLDHFISVHVDHVVVMVVSGKLEHRVTRFEVVSLHQARRFKLS